VTTDLPAEERGHDGADCRPHPVGPVDRLPRGPLLKPPPTGAAAREKGDWFDRVPAGGSASGGATLFGALAGGLLGVRTARGDGMAAALLDLGNAACREPAAATPDAGVVVQLSTTNRCTRSQP
jgi:hypothetical protein